MRSVKEEALSRLILFGERSLRHVLTAYGTPFHQERPHQGKGNVMLMPMAERSQRREGPISCLDYARQGWHRDRIAALFRLSSRDIQAALDYIDQHHDDVMASYQRIGARQKEYPYAPDVAAQIAASRQRGQARLAAIQSSRLGEQEEEHDGRHHG